MDKCYPRWPFVFLHLVERVLQSIYNESISTVGACESGRLLPRAFRQIEHDEERDDPGGGMSVLYELESICNQLESYHHIVHFIRLLLPSN